MKVYSFPYFNTYGNTSFYSVSLPPGTYKFELWGASGSDQRKFGMGAFVSGIVSFHQSIDLFVYVGEKGKQLNLPSFNGGGAGRVGFSGGGASDIRLIAGEYSDIKSLESRIIVAAGGGGFDSYKESSQFRTYGEYSHAGGLTGGKGPIKCSGSEEELTLAQGGNQTHGGQRGYGTEDIHEPDRANGHFGIGGSSVNSHSGGGGGGYYGGGSGGTSYSVTGSGGGGSSFVSGYFECVCRNHSLYNESIHYSNIAFRSIIMENGLSTFKSPEGIQEEGHLGDGFVRITVLQLFSKQYFSIKSFLFILPLHSTSVLIK